MRKFLGWALIVIAGLWLLGTWINNLDDDERLITSLSSEPSLVISAGSYGPSVTIPFVVDTQVFITGKVIDDFGKTTGPNGIDWRPRELRLLADDVPYQAAIYRACSSAGQCSQWKFHGERRTIRVAEEGVVGRLEFHVNKGDSADQYGGYGRNTGFPLSYRPAPGVASAN
jgi:hypothetical protein